MKEKHKIIQNIGIFFEQKPNIYSLIVALFFSCFFVIDWVANVTPLICAGGADCVKYSEMAQSFASGNFKAIEHPFNLRVMAPWLASFFPADITKGFVVINSVSAIFFVVFVYEIAKKIEFRNIEFAILISWFFIHPLGFGLYAVIPPAVDPISYFFIGLISLLFFYQKPIIMWLVVLCALFAKESFSFIAMIIIISELVCLALSRSQRIKFAIISLAGILSVWTIYSIGKDLILLHFFKQSQEWEITTSSTISWWIEETKKDPYRLIIWVGAFFCSTGVFSAFISLRIFSIRDPIKARAAIYLVLGGLGYTAFGILAGSDMSRIIFNGNFFIMSTFLLCFRMKNLPLRYLIIAFILSEIIALNYTKFFPSLIEYDYFMNNHRVLPTIYFILINFFIVYAIRIFSKKIETTKSQPIDFLKTIV